MGIENTKIKVPTPADFTWEEHPLENKIYTDGRGHFTVTDFDITTYRMAGQTYYVDGENGSDSNDGLSEEAAFLNVFKAMDQADAQVIAIRGGLYNRSSIFQGPIDKDITIESWDETPVELSAHDNLNWTQEADYENVYSASRSFGYQAVDTLRQDEYGNYIPYETVESIEEVANTPGSFYTDNSTVYVHAFDDRPVDNSILVHLIVYNFRNEGGYTVYLDNIRFLGGRTPFDMNETTGTYPSLYARNARMLYGERGDGGLTAVNADQVYLERCQAAYNVRDGFNYHMGDVETKVIEIDCIGYNNGADPDNYQNNGSSIHDGGSIIRVGGSYFYNGGPNIHDIFAGTKAWNLGITAGMSTTSLELRNADYYLENEAESWFDSCVSYGSEISLRLVNGTTTQAHLRNTELWDREDISDGSIDKY